MIPSIAMDKRAVSTDVLSQYLDDLRQLTRTQLRAMCGSVNYGVVSLSDPTVKTTTNPLWVELVSGTNTSLRILAGTGVTQSGDFVRLESEATADLASVGEGAVNVVFLHLELVTNPVRVLASTNTRIPTGTHWETKLSVLPKASYLALDTEYRQQGLVLATVTYYAAGSVVSLTGEDWVRPWFSCVDIAHRSRIGSGSVTVANPHALAISDLVDANGMSVYRHLTRTGMVWSPDSSVSGIPGYLCSETFAASDIRVDASGEITRDSAFGGSGVYYVLLSAYATFISRVVDLESITNSVPVEGRYQYIADLIPGTRVLVLCTDTIPTVGLTVHYHHTPSLEITSETSGSLTFAGVDSNEQVITEGVALSDVQSSIVFVRRYNGIPCNVRAFIRKSGEIVLDPAVLAASVKPADAVAGITLDQTFTTPMYLGVGATKLGTAANQVLAVELVGTGVDGAYLSETIQLDPDTWEDTLDVIASVEPMTQILYTTKPFLTLSYYAVTTNTGNDVTGYFQVYGKIDPARAHTAQLASFFWNKREMKNLRDTRRILPVVRDGLYGVTSITTMGELISASNLVLASQSPDPQVVQLIISEDFQQPRYLDAGSVIWEGRDVLDVPVIPWNTTDSYAVTNCYRSRVVPINKLPQQPCYVVVVLHNADSARQEYGAVRFLLENYDNIYEVPAMLLSGDSTKRIYLGLIVQSDSAALYRGISFIVSGKCQGFSAFFIVPNSSVSNTYKLTPTQLAYTRNGA